MELSTEYSASVYCEELPPRSKQMCSYDLRGCTSNAKWAYSIGAGLSHLGGHALLHACEEHSESVRKHAEKIVLMVMDKTRAERSDNGDV